MAKDLLVELSELNKSIAHLMARRETLKKQVLQLLNAQDTNSAKPKRQLSAAARKKMSDTAKKRWVEWRKQNKR